MRCRRTTRSGSAPECGAGRPRDRQKAAPTAPPPLSTKGSGSRPACQEALRTGKHQHDKDSKSEDIAPLEVEVEAGYRDDFGKQKRRDKAADHIAEAAEHADQKGDGAKGQAHKRLHVILKDQKAG